RRDLRRPRQHRRPGPALDPRRAGPRHHRPARPAGGRRCGHVTAVAVNDLAILASRPARKLGAWEALTQACQAHPSRSDYRGELGRVVTFEVDDPDALVAELTGGG